jgi:hypothetical protein
MEWSPGKVEFYLDGHSLGAGTSRTPNIPMHYILQTEACLFGCPKPETAGHVYLDWIAILEAGLGAPAPARLLPCDLEAVRERVAGRRNEPR